MQLQGFIANAQKRKTPPSKKTGKSYTVFDAEIHHDDGTKTQVSFGFDEPEVGPGDYIRCDAFDKNGFLQIDQSTIQRLQPPPAPARVSSPPATETARAGSGASTDSGTPGNGIIASAAGNSSQGNYAVREYGYKTDPEDAKRMTFASAAGRAIDVVALLLQHDALPHSKAKGKGGEAQRYQEIMAAIDKVTVKYFNDALSLRSLAVIADEGVISVKASSNLPEDDKQTEGLDD